MNTASLWFDLKSPRGSWFWNSTDYFSRWFLAKGDLLTEDVYIRLIVEYSSSIIIPLSQPPKEFRWSKKITSSDGSINYRKEEATPFWQILSLTIFVWSLADKVTLANKYVWGMLLVGCLPKNNTQLYNMYYYSCTSAPSLNRWPSARNFRKYVPLLCDFHFEKLWQWLSEGAIDQRRIVN